MASTYSDLKIQLMATGENSGTWGTITNTNLGTALEEAIVGSANVTFSSADVTLTWSDTNSSQTARNLRLNLTGTVSAAQNLIVPAIEKVYIVNNGLSYAITVKNSTGTGIAVPAGKTMYVYNNGTNVVDVVTHLSSLTLSTVLPVTSGGTGTNTSTGSGNVVLSTSPTLVTPVLGTPASGTLTNCTGLPLTTGVTGTLPNGNTTASSSNGSSTIVARDASGNFTANTVTANIAATTINTTTINGTNFNTANFSITESGGVLYIKYGSTNLMKIDSSGNITVKANVTSYGTV